MGAIARREFNAYFTSAIGYIFIAVFFLISGVFFSQMVNAGYSTMNTLYMNLFTIMIFMIPILTMRLMSEDKKLKTDQALLTAPVSLFGIAMGKFLAAVAMFLVTISITLVESVVAAIFVNIDWAIVFSNFLGIFLAGCAMISIGMFISALTENQVIAAVGAFAAALVLTLLDNVIPSIKAPFLKELVSGVSFNDRFADFYYGVIDLSNIVFFLGITAIFIFLTVRTLEKRRWS